MIDVVCALLIHNGKILIVKHGDKPDHAFRWEFPGGKVQAGEQEEAALKREIEEELGISILPSLKLAEVAFTYPGKTIRLKPYICHSVNLGIVLKEHVEMRWVSPMQILDFDLLEADRLILKNEENFTLLIDKCREDMEEGTQDSSPSYN